MGRFINKDPIEESGGLNLYGFCVNNVVNKWDYLGMDDYDLSKANPLYRDQIYRIIQTSKLNVANAMASNAASFWIGAALLSQNAGAYIPNSPGGPASGLLQDRLVHDQAVNGVELGSPRRGSVNIPAFTVIES